jgi:hypothetical protein
MLRARLSLGLVCALVAIFALAAWSATGFGRLAAYFPFAVAFVGCALAVTELISLRRSPAVVEAGDGEAEAELRKNLIGGARNFLWIALYLIGTVLAGFLSSTAVFLFLMLWRGASYRPHIAALMALAACLFMHFFGGFIDLVLPVGWVDDAILRLFEP